MSYEKIDFKSGEPLMASQLNHIEAGIETAQTTADNAIARLDDMGKELLWANASPSSAFGEQQVNLDIKNGDVLLIDYLIDASAIIHIWQLIVVDGVDVRHNIDTRYRTLIANNGGIFFKSGYSGNTQNNNVIVPNKIYRIK